MKRFETGLVVGKFCPLHRGHELVIQSALDQCRRVIVLSYTKPEFPDCPPRRRAAWLGARFPAAENIVIDDAELARRCQSGGVVPRPVPPNDAPDDIQRDFVAWFCMDVIGTMVDAVYTSEDYGAGFAAVLTDRFRVRRAGAHVTHVSIDRERAAVPVSGTAIRSDPHRYRAFLSPEVYASFVARVGILGGESSGKTTLAERLAQRLGTVWVPEYGRQLWVERRGHLVYEDMLAIALTQIEREEAALRQATRWLICDTSPLTTLLYSQAMFGSADAKLMALADRPYGHTFLCEPDFAFVQDGTRKTPEFRQSQHDWYVAQLKRRGWAFTQLAGPVEERVALAAETLGAAVEPLEPRTSARGRSL